MSSISVSDSMFGVVLVSYLYLVAISTMIKWECIPSLFVISLLSYWWGSSYLTKIKVHNILADLEYMVCENSRIFSKENNHIAGFELTASRNESSRDVTRPKGFPCLGRCSNYLNYAPTNSRRHHSNTTHRVEGADCA